MKEQVFIYLGTLYQAGLWARKRGLNRENVIPIQGNPDALIGFHDTPITVIARDQWWMEPSVIMDVIPWMHRMTAFGEPIRFLPDDAPVSSLKWPKSIRVSSK